MAEPSVKVRYSVGCGTVLLFLIFFWMTSGKVDKIQAELDGVKTRLAQVERKLAEIDRRPEPAPKTP